MPNIEFFEKPDLQSSILVGAWTGWPDAAEAATRAINELIRQMDATKFASIDPEEFYVFSEHRPSVSNAAKGSRRLSWPENNFYYWRSPDEGQTDVVFLVGEEPDLRWREYTRLIASVARENNCKLLVTVGALLDSVPHTREPRVMGTALSDDLGPGFEGINYPRPNYEGPSGITSVVIDALSQVSVPAVSVWGHAPHYVQVPYNPTITMAILHELKKFIAYPIDLGPLEKQSEEFKVNLVKALEGQRDIAGYVRKLEERYDSEEHARSSPEPRQLMADLEEFLRQQREGEGKNGEQTS